MQVSDCYHDCLGVILAEDRLQKFGQEGGYLTRQSDVKPGFFILSVIEKEVIIHQVAPNKNGKFFKQTFDEAAISLEEMIQIKVECEHPVPPSAGDIVSPVEKEPSKCKACSFTNENLKKVQDHERTHYVRKCLNCQKFIKGPNFQRHTRQCQQSNLNLVKHHCGIDDCKFSTYHDFSLKRHRKTHKGSFKCVSCPKFFRTKEKLEKHKDKHLHEGFPCQHCGKCFTTSHIRVRHVREVHLEPVVRRSKIGFARWEESMQKRKKGRIWHHCLVEKCGYKTHVQDRMKKHQEKHTKDPPIKNVFSCDGCGFKTNVRSRIMRHTKSCLRFIALKQRVVPIVKNSGLTKIAMKHNISLKMFKDLMKDFSKENPAILMERNLEDALKESVEALSSWYSSDMINVIDSKSRGTISRALVLPSALTVDRASSW